MDLSGRPIRCFIAVAEERSFSRAALRLHMSQPALSAQVRAFEQQLGFDLFLRTSRHVELTCEGKLLLSNARRFAGEATIFNRAARDILANEMRIGAAAETALIPERAQLIERFIEKHPRTQFEIMNASQTRHFQSLVNRDIDVAIVVEAAEQAATSDPVANLERLVLRNRPAELAVPVESPLAALATLSLDELSGVQIAVPDQFGNAVDMSDLTRRLAQAGAQLVRPPEGNAIAVEQYAAFKRIAAVSLGWIEAPMSEYGETVRRPVAGLEFSTSLNLVRMHGQYRAATEQFWTTAAELIDRPRLASKERLFGDQGRGNLRVLTHFRGRQALAPSQ